MRAKSWVDVELCSAPTVQLWAGSFRFSIFKPFLEGEGQILRRQKRPSVVKASDEDRGNVADVANRKIRGGPKGERLLPGMQHGNYLNGGGEVGDADKRVFDGNKVIGLEAAAVRKVDEELRAILVDRVLFPVALHEVRREAVDGI